MERKQQHILLVEDNPDDVKLTLRALRKNRFADVVDVARDGVEALEYLSGQGRFAGRDTGVLPQLILLDLNMPRMDGLALLKSIRANETTRLLAVVILTTSEEIKDRVEGYRLGADGYLLKPLDFGQFADALKKLGLTWLVLDEAHGRVDSKPLSRVLREPKS
jgi:two-component system, response regulator